MRKRNNQITVRLHPKHYKKLQKKAEKENMSISEFVRKVVMKTEFRDLSKEDYAEMKRQVRELYQEIEKIETEAEKRKLLPMETLDKSLEINFKIRDIINHYYEKQYALGTAKKMPKWYKWTNKEHRLCIRLNDEERLKLDDLQRRSFIKQNTLVTRLCLGELIPLKKPQAYYDTLRYINSIGDYRLKPMYHYAENPKEAWNKICDIQATRDDAMNLIRNFV